MFRVVVEGLALLQIEVFAGRLASKASCKVGRDYGLLSCQQPLYKELSKLF